MQHKPEAQHDKVAHGDCYEGSMPEQRPAQDGGEVDGAVADASAQARPRGVLLREDIRHRVRAHGHEARRCNEDGLRHDPSLQGRLVYQWTIGATGSVHLWQRLQDEPKRKDWSDTLTDIFGKPLAEIQADLQRYADTEIVGHLRAPRLRQMAVRPIGDVPLRDRESDPIFVEEACRSLKKMYEKR